MRETKTHSDTASVSEQSPTSTARTEKATKAQLERQTEIDDLAWLMSDARGRRVMRRLLARSGIYRTSFNADPATMAFMEGRRDMGLWLVDEISQHAPKRFIEMQKEQLNERKGKEAS